MYSIVKTECRRALSRWQMLAAFLLMQIFLIQGYVAYYPFHAVHLSSDYVNYYLGFLYASGQGPSAMLAGIFPLVIALAAGDSLAWDRRTGYQQYALLRTTYKRYIGGKLIAVSLISLLFVLVAELFAFGYGMIVLPSDDVVTNMPGVSPDYALGLFLKAPFLHVLLVIGNAGLYAMVIAMFSLLLSTFVKNIYLVIAAPWLLSFVLQFVFNSINWQRYAPLNLLGLYLWDQDPFALYELPLTWVALWAVLLMLTYVSFSRHFAK